MATQSQAAMRIWLFSLVPETVILDYIIFRECVIHIESNYSNCNILHTNSSSEAAIIIEKDVQTYASVLIFAKSLMNNAVPAILALFLGPWSDKYGRKPLLLVGYGGEYTLYFKHPRGCFLFCHFPMLGKKRKKTGSSHSNSCQHESTI